MSRIKMDPPDDSESRHLAKILRSETVAREALRVFGSAKQTLRATDRELLTLGVKPAAIRNVRAFQQLAQQSTNCASADDVVRIHGARIAHLPYEVFAVVGIDAKAKTHGFVQIAQGGTNDVAIDVPELLRAGLRMGCAAIVVMHNHPSGSSIASPEDLLLTRRIVACGKMIGLPLVDHIVVAATEFTSIATEAPACFSGS